MWQLSEKLCFFAPHLKVYHFPQHWNSLLPSNRHTVYEQDNICGLKLEVSTSKCAAFFYVKTENILQVSH